MMNIKGAIFDMDGTLVDSLFLWEVVWKAFGEKYLDGKTFVPGAADDKAVRTLPLKDAMQLIHDHYRLGESGEELYTFVNDLIQVFYANDVQLKSGVREFLEHCHQNGVKMCIASATAPDLVETAVKHCGIDHCFSKIFSCATLGKGKECPDIYLLAQDFLGTQTAETWVFEDSLVALETAATIGMPTVGIYDPCNAGQDRIQKTATEYIAPGETLLKLITNK